MVGGREERGSGGIRLIRRGNGGAEIDGSRLVQGKYM